MRSDRDSTDVLSWPRVAVAVLVPAGVGIVAAASGSVLERRELGVMTLMALVFALVEIVVQTGPSPLRRRPNLFRAGVAAVLLLGLAASGAIGPT